MPRGFVEAPKLPCATHFFVLAMSLAAPWFGVLYVTAFAATLVVLTNARRLPSGVALVLAGYAVAAAALCGGLAVRGLRFDVSGEPFALPRIPVTAAMPAKFGPPDGRDAELSVDLFASADDPHGAAPALVLRETQSAEIDGWAFDAHDRAPCTGVAVFVDGKPFAAAYGTERTDVAAAMGSDHRFTGFRAVLPARSAGRGSHRVTLRCLAAAGRSYEGGAAFTLKVGP